MLAYIRVELNLLEALSNEFISPASKNQFVQEIIFNTSPARRIAIAMNTKSGFIESKTENPICYQQFNL